MMAQAMLCPVLIEREDEFARLVGSVGDAASGNGGVVVLVGEAGVGKTRLGREVRAHAESCGFVTLSGRASDGSAAVPYRALTEAFANAFRSVGPPTASELAGFEGQLGRLVPHWRRDASGGSDESSILLSESVVRLLRLLGGDAPCLLVLEDMHWADAETLGIVEYLADALVDQRIMCLCTARPDPVVLEALDRLRRAAATTVVTLSPLSVGGIEQAVMACLDSDRPPPDALACVVANSEGIPFLIEELLAGLTASAELTLDEDRWVTTGRLTPMVPHDFAESIRQRLSTLDEVCIQVVRAAALLGQRFDWELLAQVAEVDDHRTLDALRAAVRAQIVAVEGSDFVFRHALTRQAVVDDLLPPERRALARRALPAVECAHPDLPGEWCELAAELAEMAGDSEAASRHLIECASRALVGGAFSTAEAIANRARSLAQGHPATELDADELLVQVLALAGKPTPASTIGQSLLSRLADIDGAGDRRVDLLVMLARAALASGDDAAAAAHVADAERIAASGRVDPAVAARIEAVSAHVALAEGSFDRAEALARSAVERAVRTVQPDVECEALEVIARVARHARGEPGVEWLERAAAVADRNGMTGWLVRARHELALTEWADHGRVEPLREARELAMERGALVTAAVMDLSLADVALASFDREGCLRSAERCVDASRRYGLATLSVAYLWLAGAHALAGDEVQMEAAAALALECDPADPRILGDLWGRVRATLSIVRDDRDRLRSDLNTMMEYARATPAGRSFFPNRLLWAMLHTAEDSDHGAPARAELAAANVDWSLQWAKARAMVEVVAEARRRPTEELAARFAELSQWLLGNESFAGTTQYLHVVAAEAAIRDGWGEPVSWLRRAEAFFSAREYRTVARRCRRLLGEAGAPMPRRGRGHAVVPPDLRALGITSRELDVLLLVATGLSNREIGERLYLSPKTVERHMSSLFQRTGTHDRQALAGLVHSLADGPGQ